MTEPSSSSSPPVIAAAATPSSPMTATAPTFRPKKNRDNSIDIHTANHLFRPSNRFSSRTSAFDISLDLTVSSGATFSSGGYTTSNNTDRSDFHNASFSINSAGQESSSSVGTLGTVKFRANHFVAQRLLPLEAVYQIGELLGEGGYGEVYRCWHSATGSERAVKVIPKAELALSCEQDVMREFHLLKQCDHPNLLKVYECLEDAQHYYIVSDIIKGGELYDELERCGNLSEEDAKVLLSVLLTCINYCHQRGLVHRDLKPENILLEPNLDFHQLKVIDFGLGVQQQADTTAAVLSDIEGSQYYMSPQVLQGHYSSKCDIWACGVIAYVMLGGYAPFDADTEEEIHQAILEGHFDFEEATWTDVSEEAKDFIMTLLTYKEEERPTAEQCLQHPWLRGNSTLYRADHRRRASTRASLNDLQSFHSADSKLKQATCAIIASQLLSKHETEQIEDIFRDLDVSGRGSLTCDDLKQSFQDYFVDDAGGGGAMISDEQVKELLRQVNFSGSGAIEYSEFAIALMMEQNMIDDDKLQAAFNYFDRDGTGYISPQNLKDALGIDDSTIRGGSINEYVTKKIIGQVDADGNGLIDFDEFKNMMLSKTVKPRLSIPRRCSRNRLSFTRQQKIMLEELNEHVAGEDDDEKDDLTEVVDRLGTLKSPPSTIAPTSNPHHKRPSVCRHRKSVTETVLEEECEDCSYSESESETQEESLGDEEEEDELDISALSNSQVHSPKRRKARSFCASGVASPNTTML